MFVYSITIMVDRRMPFASTYFNTRNHFLLRRFGLLFARYAVCQHFYFASVFFIFFLSSFHLVLVFGILVLLLFFFAHLFAAPMNLRIPNANRKKTNKKS